MEIRMIGVVGAGQMGSGIAEAALTSGFHVLMRDVTMEAVEKGEEIELNMTINPNIDLPQTPAYFFVTLDYENEEQFFKSELEKISNFVEEKLKIYQKERGKKLTLNEFKIAHQFELYDDPKATLTPHILGIGYHIIPAMRFCLQFIK